LLRRCLEKDARKRLRDIGDARLELEEAVAARTSKSRITAAEVEAARSAARTRTPVWAYAIAALGLAVGAFAMSRSMLGAEPRATTRPSRTEPEGASFVGDAVDCAISPDGRTFVAAAAESAGTVQLWARSLQSLGARPIAGTDNAAKPFWSPDSRWIGFFADGKLKRARLAGGVENVCDAPNGRGGAWSTKGVIVFTAAGEGPIYAVNASGGESRPITALDSTRHETAHRFPSFLPDQKHFL